MTSSSLVKVLTVEDDPIVRADLRLILEDAGFDVCPDARDGIEAIAMAREHRPDLILLDLGLPRLDGVGAARQILGERDVPIVALTGHSNQAVLDRAVAAGTSGTVLKPFSEHQLVDTLRDVLDTRAERKAQERHLRIMIENMLSQGYSEREIERAVLEASPWIESDQRRIRRSTPRRWLRRQT
jgi:response regulator NasT